MIDEISYPRSILLAFSLTLTLGSALPAPAQDPAVVCRAVAAELRRGDVAAVAARFDEGMKAALPGPKLEEVWKSLVQQLGPLGACSEPKARGATAAATCRFEKERLSLEVTVAADGRLAGLFFRPAPPEGPSAPPAYSRPGAFRESAVTVGTGDWALPGTLTLPAGDGPFAAVVLVHGSGPHDRDETVGGVKPFRDLAEGLGSRGIAVVRYDKRTQVHAAKVMSAKELTVDDETVQDAVLAAALLRKTPRVDARRVFVLGHSLGAMVAPRIGKADPSLAGVVLLAGNARPLTELVVEQLDYLASLDGGKSPGEAFEAMKREAAKVQTLQPGSKEMVLGAPASYWLDLRGYEPVATLRPLPQPALILQGERDYQVTMKDLALWREGLKGRAGVTFKSYPKLNHLFVEGEGKSTPAEYQKPGHVSGEVVEDVASWIERTRP